VDGEAGRGGLRGGKVMPEVFYMIICLGLVVGGGFFLWKTYKAEELRKREEEQRKHELKMSRPRLKQEKAQMRHEQKMAKTLLKREKVHTEHEQKMNGLDTTTEIAIKAIPESLKSIENIAASVENIVSPSKNIENVMKSSKRIK
jgi:hypothetical protein